MHQSIVQHRRERMQVFMGFGARHRTLLPEHIKGGIRLVIIEDTRSFLCHGGQFPLGTTARFTSSRAGCDPFCIRVLPGCLVQVSADGQHIVALDLGQTGQGLHLTVISDEETHELASSMAFLEDSLPCLLLRNNSIVQPPLLVKSL
jgi:hypothetical protein